MLDQIEKALLAEDPGLSKRVKRHTAEASGGNPLRGVALILLGLCFLIGGIALAQQSLWFVGLSVLGFLIMFGGGLVAVTGGSRKKGRAKSTARGAAEVKRGAATPKKNGAQDSLGSRLDENFRRRFEN